MGRKRKMPSRKDIFYFWENKMKKACSDNTCFKCGLISFDDKIIVVERCHIVPVCEGGSDDLDNIHLLCYSCHKESEVYSGKKYNLWLKSKNKEQFAKALFVLWEKGFLKGDEINQYFTKAKEIFIKKEGQFVYDYTISEYKEEVKKLIELW
tara:strand:- start:33 stop:488 length:456 start_codon:yes stop_codon:yes gene_type:complete